MPRLPFVQAMKARKADRYLAPELADGSEIDHRADLYSVGVILGEMLSGLTPDGAIPELQRRNPDVPQAVEGIYRKAINSNPNARFKSAGELIAEFTDQVKKASPPPLNPNKPRSEPATGTPAPTSRPRTSTGMLQLQPRREIKPPPPVPDSVPPPPPPSSAEHPMPIDATQPVDPSQLAEALALKKQQREPDRQDRQETEIINSGMFIASLDEEDNAETKASLDAVPDGPPPPPPPVGPAPFAHERARASSGGTKTWLFVVALVVLGVGVGAGGGFLYMQRLRSQQQQQQQEAEKAAAEKAAADKLAADKAADAERLASEKAAAEKADAERLAAMKDKENTKQTPAEKAAAERAERERLAGEKATAAQADRAEKERLAAEKNAAAQADRLEKDKAARAAAEKQAAERAAAIAAAAAAQKDKTPPTPVKTEGGCPEGMRPVAGGAFKMGTAPGDQMMAFDEKALAAVETGAYCIDTFEYPNKRGAAPMAAVGWADAKRLCEAQSKRLCSEAEWEKACKGPGGAKWPYGSGFDANACNTEDDSGDPRALAPSGRFTKCRSGYGVADLSGNVSEWTSDKIVKGGSFASSDYAVRCSARKSSGGGKNSEVGFRCCADQH
jgi:hypothetical protein